MPVISQLENSLVINEYEVFSFKKNRPDDVTCKPVYFDSALFTIRIWLGRLRTDKLPALNPK